MEQLRENERWVKTNSLNPQENPIVERLIDQASVVVSDVDYTLVNFEKGHQEGQKRLADLFGQYFADEVEYLFRLTLEGQRKPLTETWVYRRAYTILMNKIKALQSSFIDTHGIKVFSREVEIAIVADRLGIGINKKLIERGRDAYWSAVGEIEALYPDAQSFIDTIHKKSKPFFLMSGSDSIMKVNEDCSFDYDPDVSYAYKRKRFEKFPFHFNEAFFGDPIDKPDPRFFEMVFMKLKKNLGYMVTKENILFVGDSPRNDLEIPFERGCTTLLIKRS